MGFTIYKTEDGERVPGVTTVLRMFGGDNEGLIRWAHKLGTNGQSLDDARKKAQNIGTVAHAMIESHLDGETLDTDGVDVEVLQGASRAFGMFKEWSGMVGYEVLAKEEPLVCEELRYGGKMDCVMIQARRVLADWKTSARIYPEHLCQVAAYGKLWDQHYPDQPIEGYVLLRLGKDEALFDHHYRPADSRTMLAAWEAFKHCRALYDLAKTIKKGV